MKNNIIIEEPIVSVEWLHQNLEAKNLIILNASINKITNNKLSLVSKEQIPNTRFFDLKNKFSIIHAPFPNTVPSEIQFSKEARELGINTDSAIVVYDDKGVYSSPRVWWLFKAFGFENIAVLDGGFPKWKESNYSVEIMKEFTHEIGNISVNYRPKYFNFFNDIKSLTKDDDCLIIDARSKQRFDGLIDEPRKGIRRGTIINSKNLPYTEMLNENCLKSKSELLSIFSKLVGNNEHLIFSCGSGITACILALGAEISGFQNLSVYDGSWTEYGSLILE